MTKYPVRKIVLKTAGKSTLGGLDVWYDPIVGRLNNDDRGDYLGNFQAEDQIIAFYKDGSYEITSFESTNRCEPNQILSLSQFSDNQPVTAVYLEGESKICYIKRFIVETSKANKRFLFISEHKSSKLLFASYGEQLQAEVVYKEKRKKETQEIELTTLIDVKGWKAIGNKFPVQQVQEITVTKALPPSSEVDDKEDDSEVLEELKNQIKEEVEKEDNQLGLFGGGDKPEE